MDHCEKEERVKNPKETANIVSNLTFAYTFGLFKKGFKNSDLEESDLYEVVTRCGSKRCGDKIEKQWMIENKKDTPPSIIRLLWSRFGVRYLSLGLINLVWRIGTSILEPYAVSSLISYFKEDTKLTKHDAYFYAALVMMQNIFQCFYLHNYIINVQQLGIEIKTAFSSLLYRKALKLTPSALSEISLGNIVTLITKDVHTFFLSIWMINDTWIGMVQTITVCYLLYAKIGPVAFVGISVLFSVVPLQLYLGKLVSRLRLKAGKKTDQRLQVTQETLSTIRIIKMYTWERFFDKKVTDSRIEEINKMLIVFYLKFVLVILGILCSRIGFYILVMCYVWMGYSTNTELVFYILSIFKDLRHTLGIVIPFGMGRAAELYSSIVRISKVIKAEELPPKKGTDEPTEKPLIELKDATVHINKQVVLKDVTFRTDSGLTLVTGTVGSGKSSLLKAMLQDYPLTSGHMVTHGRISYASQDPWLFPSSIKQNILFGQKFDEKRYQDVVRVCALQYDFNLFDKGDETIVTDRGLNLSKGQQARVNLARAIYKDSEIYLLDDSLTALDAHVQDYIFNECIKKYLKDKVCVLVTQTASHIQEADCVVIMDKARIKSIGKPDEKIIEDLNELVCKDDDLEKEVVEEQHDDEQDEKGEEDKLLETEQTTKKKIYGEVNKKGEVDFIVYKKYLMFGGGILLMLLNVSLFGITQFTESYSDQLITKWVDYQQKVLGLEGKFAKAVYSYANLNNTNGLNSTYQNLNITTQSLEAKSILANMNITTAHPGIFRNLDTTPQPFGAQTTYRNLDTSTGSPEPNTTFKYLSNTRQSLRSNSTLENIHSTTPSLKLIQLKNDLSIESNLKEGVEDNSIIQEINNTIAVANLTLQQTQKRDLHTKIAKSIHNNGYIVDHLNGTHINSTISNLTSQLEMARKREKFTINLYSLMILVSTVLSLIKTYTLFDFCRRASINLHKAMSRTIIYAVMSFFDTHFIGNILNRFSQDLNNIDEHLPFVFSECFRVAFSVSGIVFLMVSVNKMFLIPCVLFFAILVVLRKLYLPTSRSLKRLEAATRSPMMGHLNASLEGLTTIRAYKAQSILIDEFDRHQDLYTSSNFTLTCTTRAFGFTMDALCSILIGIVVSVFVFLDTGTSAGGVGLAITQVFMLAGHVQWGVRNWAELENLMTSVERVLEYTEIKQEPTGGATLEDWPTEGAITYENVTLTYNNNEKVLKNLNFKVEPKQKIGIVGRTGAGKSSIISSLFRLYEVEGKVIIDNVNIRTLSLKYLRKKIAIIPQDPVLFTGTIRTNVDPFNEFSDEEIWKVLGKLHLKNMIKTLNFEITDSGALFSSGQKQLMCLARALIRKTKVVILDEATANMDHETDALLHDTIKENFSDCTVFIIAHRLHSILECDKVLVLDRGEIMEFDDPVSLMENKDGMFYKMVEQAGLLNYLS